jgi:hypothetical protein
MAKKSKTGLSLLDGFSGKIGKQFVLRQYADMTVIAKYPRLKKNRKLTDLKKLYEERFCNAIDYAKTIARIPELRMLYEEKLRPGQRVYDYAKSEYLKITDVNDSDVAKAFIDLPWHNIDMVTPAKLAAIHKQKRLYLYQRKISELNRIIGAAKRKNLRIKNTIKVTKTAKS